MLVHAARLTSVGSWSYMYMYLEHLCEEVNHFRAEVGWDVKLTRLDFLEQHGHIAVIKRERSTEQGIQDYSARSHNYSYKELVAVYDVCL